MGLLLPMTAEEIITWTKYGTLSMTFREISGMFALLPTSEASPFQATAWIKERSSVHSFLCTFITRKKFKILKKYLVFFHCTIWDDGLRTGFLSFFFFFGVWGFILPYIFKNVTYFIFGCARSSWLLASFVYLWWVGLLSRCSAWASLCSVFSCCGAQALGSQVY